MTLVLELPPETEARLRDRAHRAGKAIETLALETLQVGLSNDSTGDSTGAELSTDAWLAEFDAWIGSQQPRNPRFDDSRESIYADR